MRRREGEREPVGSSKMKQKIQEIKRNRRSIQLARFLCIVILPHLSDLKEENTIREVRRRRTEKECPVMFKAANPIEPVWVQPE